MLAALIPLLEAIIPLLPQIPELIAGIEAAIGIAQQTTPITPAQQAQLDAALDAAHKALQTQQQGA
ncbi:MAG TPA: hypothetical protein VKU84_16905 [Stellaceae bacterium]|nr:hypothetical protein [Stellaceae bacterium]